MNSFELTTLVTTATNAIACNLSVGEIALLASVFVQIGDTLATIAAKRSLCEEKETSEE